MLSIPQDCFFSVAFKGSRRDRFTLCVRDFELIHSLKALVCRKLLKILIIIPNTMIHLVFWVGVSDIEHSNSKVLADSILGAMGKWLAIAQPLNGKVRVIDGCKRGFEVDVIAFIAFLQTIHENTNSLVA